MRGLVEIFVVDVAVLIRGGDIGIQSSAAATAVWQDFHGLSKSNRLNHLKSRKKSML